MFNKIQKLALKAIKGEVTYNHYYKKVGNEMLEFLRNNELTETTINFEGEPYSVYNAIACLTTESL